MSREIEQRKSKVSSDPLAVCGTAIQDGVSTVLGNWGFSVASNPLCVILVFLALIGALGSGVALTEQETETGNLWTPSGSQVLEDRDLYEEFFGAGFRTQTIYVKAADAGGNAVSPAVLDAAFEIDSYIRTTLNVTIDNSTYGFQQLCEKNRETDPCVERFNPVSYYDPATQSLQANLPEIVEKSFAGAVKDAGTVVFADTIKLTYILSRANDTNRRDSNCVEEAGSSGQEGCNPTLVWENEFTDWLEEFDAENDDVRLFVQAQNSISKVLGSIIGGDIVALNIAFALIVVYAVLVLGKFHPVLSRAGVAFVGVCCVGASILCTYGIGGYTNVPVTPVTSLLPFILVGIGVDDMFVLVGALDRAPADLSIPRRIERMMMDAGTSITMTSLTDMLAFALGTLTSFPALRYFCIYAAIGIMLDWLFQITIFVAALAYDEQRRKERRVDCTCFFVCAKEGVCCPSTFVKEEDMSNTCCDGRCCIQEGGYLRSFMRDSFAPALINPAVKGFLLLVMIGFLATGIVGIGKLEEEFSLRYFVPSDDPLQDVFRIADREFQTGETIVNVLLDHRHGKDAIYLHSSLTPAEVERVTASLEAFVWYEDDTLISPLELFAAWLPTVNATYPSDTKEFYDYLHLYLATDGSQFAGYFAVYDWYAGFIEWIAGQFDGVESATASVDFAGSSWLQSEFDAVTMRPLNARHYCSLLKSYLEEDGAEHSPELRPALGSGKQCYPASGDVAMHRVSVAMKCALEGDCPESNATAAVEVMDGVRELAAALESPLAPVAYSFQFLDAEQFKVVRREAVVNLSLALAAVAAVTLLLLGHLLAGILVVASVCMVLIDIVGLMWLWGITINSVSIINLVLAIGLAVDYSAHIAHAFMAAVGTRDERMVQALGEMGADVTHGALSTFLAVIITAGSKSYIFQAFFRQFFGICLFGILHGLVFLPIILSLIGPAARVPVDDEDEDEDEESRRSSKPPATSPPRSKNSQKKAKTKTAWAESATPLASVAAGGSNFGVSRSVAGSLPATPAQPPALKLASSRGRSCKRSSLELVALDEDDLSPAPALPGLALPPGLPPRPTAAAAAAEQLRGLPAHPRRVAQLS